MRLMSGNNTPEEHNREILVTSRVCGRHVSVFESTCGLCHFASGGQDLSFEVSDRRLSLSMNQAPGAAGNASRLSPIRSCAVISCRYDGRTPCTVREPQN